jgi:hypothetical protein
VKDFTFLKIDSSNFLFLKENPRIAKIYMYRRGNLLLFKCLAYLIEWQVAETGWIYVVGDTTRAGKALLTLLVDDLEDYVAELGERGLATSAIDTVPGLYRKAVMTDPEGNMISIGSDLSTDN